ncbi:interleukin-12 subunit alpha [Silurus meridionalis]|uniref:Interleukin-12 subunit alpha n=1 Tax=Silurus meridionalis TaxID=175797 RepID=A0A8T0ALY1_SILME|nr:interleukin-12 subunit alpha [Silurus meridionalis]KAF7692749.1 hypothetical protein HF521_010359 [Silurus meridionalis]
MYGSVVYALVLALLSRAAVATPVRATQSTPHDHAHCTTYARGLLSNLKLVLDKPEKTGTKTLFHGFNCTDLEAVVNSNTQTASVCQPSQDVKCSDQKTSPFSKTECLQNIANDLNYHQSMLTEYVSNQKLNSESIKELNSITNSILNLQQHCKLLPKPESLKDKWSPKNSFEDRKDLCKQLKGFQLRTITINRAIGYVCAGEYRK